MGSRDRTDNSCGLDRIHTSNCLNILVSMQTTRAKSQSFQRSCHFSPCNVILALAIFQNVGLAAARITLPVIRSFSQLEGSGTNGESHGMTAEHAMELRQHDYQRSLRHRRVLSTTVAEFPLYGNDYSVGLYYSEIGLGTPPEKYYVQVDTGSDVLWVNCKPCPNCPRSSDLEIPLRLYDPESSASAENISCSSTACKAADFIQASCVDDSCYYAFSYGDRSTAMGYFVEDMITYETDVTYTSVQNRTARIVFGCGFNQSGVSLTSSYRAVDGIMGLGRQVLAVSTQLANAGLTTNEFAHCLQGDTGQGGTFVIGDINETGIVYTGMVEGQPHYNVALQSISVGGIPLDVPSSAFDVATSGGTIFDSGTTMALLTDTAYDAFVKQLLAVVTVPYTTSSDTICFENSNSNLSDSFPSVTLFFNGASMELQPTNYLYKTKAFPTFSVWCLAWSSSSSSDLQLSILGDIVLKNKLVVYDLENSRIGWVDFDCRSSVQVSNGTANQVVDPTLQDFSSGSKHFPLVYHKVSALICFVVIAYTGF